MKKLKESNFPFYDKLDHFTLRQQEDLSNSILKLLIQNFTEYEAYKLGIINQHGNELRSYDKLRSNQEKRAYNKLIRLCISLKKLINKYPNERYKFKTYYIAMQSLKNINESIDINSIDDEEILETIKNNIIEDAVGVTTGSVAGYDVPLQKVRRRNE